MFVAVLAAVFVAVFRSVLSVKPSERRGRCQS